MFVYDITDEEIFNACKKLKNNKASAYNMMSNEIMKAAFPVMQEIVVKAPISLDCDCFATAGDRHREWVANKSRISRQ